MRLGEAFVYDVNFKGPKKQRSMTDVPYFWFFAFFVCIWMGLGAWGKFFTSISLFLFAYLDITIESYEEKKRVFSPVSPWKKSIERQYFFWGLGNSISWKIACFPFAILLFDTIIIYALRHRFHFSTSPVADERMSDCESDKNMFAMHERTIALICETSLLQCNAMNEQNFSSAFVNV